MLLSDFLQLRARSLKNSVNRFPFLVASDVQIVITIDILVEIMGKWIKQHCRFRNKETITKSRLSELVTFFWTFCTFCTRPLQIASESDDCHVT